MCKAIFHISLYPNIQFTLMLSIKFLYCIYTVPLWYGLLNYLNCPLKSFATARRCVRGNFV